MPSALIIFKMSDEYSSSLVCPEQARTVASHEAVRLSTASNSLFNLCCFKNCLLIKVGRFWQYGKDMYEIK